MDPELSNLHRGAHNERRRLTPDPEPEPDRIGVDGDPTPDHEYLDEPPAHAPREPGVVCPECDEPHATIESEVDTDLDRYCNHCLATALADRMGQDAAATYVETCNPEP